MLRPIREAMSGAFKSFDLLASELQKAAPALEWPAPRSLSAKISELDRGMLTWWQRRPEHLRALLELLQISEAEVGLHEGTSDLERYAFKEFPELPPLNLRREAPLRLGKGLRDPLVGPTESLEDWLDCTPDGLTPRKPLSGITWLQIAEGTECELLLAELAAKGGFDVMRVRSLEDVSRRLENPKALVVKLAEQPAPSDLRHLLKRPPHASLLILAPTPFPGGNNGAAQAKFSWEFLNADKDERDLIALSNPGFLGGIVNSLQVTLLTWVLNDDWESQLLSWIEARLDRYQIDTLFSARGLQNWINAFDPQRHWVRTPEELMVLCRICHRKPERDLPKASDRRVADALLETVLSLKPAQARLFRKLAENRWQTITLPWEGALPEITWRSLAGGSDVVSPEALLEIADASSRERRREVAMQVAERSSNGIIDSLIEDGYLAHVGQGRYILTPPALANLIMRDWLLEQVTTSPLTNWASAFFDEPRRRLVEATLDCLSTAELSSLSESLGREPQQSANTIAASESIMVVAARRLANGEQHTESLHRCMQQVLSRLQTNEAALRVEPWTRSLAVPEERVNWLMACWAWSLTPLPADIQIAAEHAWQFPCWFQAPPSSSASRISTLVFASEGRPSSWFLLMKLGTKLIEQWESPPADPPFFLTSALLLGAARGRWDADPEWWKSFLLDKKAEIDFLTLAQSEGKTACLRLWPSFLACELSTRNEYAWHLQCVTSSTRQWILRSLSPAEILHNLTDDTMTYLRSNAVTLPPLVRSVLLEQLSDDAPEAYELLKICEGLDCSALRRWLRGRTREIAAKRVWMRPVDEIAHLLSQLSALPTESAEALFTQCPEQHIEVALNVLEGEPNLLSQEFRRCWVSQRMAYARQHAQRLIAIIQPMAFAS